LQVWTVAARGFPRLMAPGMVGMFDRETDTASAILDDVTDDGEPVEDAGIQKGEFRAADIHHFLGPVVNMDVRGEWAKVVQARPPIFANEWELEVGGEIEPVHRAQQAQRRDGILHQAALVTFEAQLDAFLAGNVAE